MQNKTDASEGVLQPFWIAISHLQGNIGDARETARLREQAPQSFAPALWEPIGHDCDDGRAAKSFKSARAPRPQRLMQFKAATSFTSADRIRSVGTK